MDLEFNKLKISEEVAEDISYNASKSQKEENGLISSQHLERSDEEVPYKENEHSSCRCRDPDYMPSFEPEDLIGINSWAFREQLEWARYNIDPYYSSIHRQHQATPSSVEKYFEDDSDEDSDVDEASEAEEEDSPAVRALLEMLRGDDDEDSADENNNVE